MRRRPIRAVLLAAAVFAIPYSLARHQGGENAQPAVSAPAPATPAGLSHAFPPHGLAPGPLAIEHGGGSSDTSWNPPIGMDRTNAALDQLTMDFSSGSRPPGPKEPASDPRVESSAAQPSSPVQTPDQRSGFPAGPRVTSADVEQPAPVPAPAKTPADEAPAAEPPADIPAKVPATPPRVAKANPLEEIDQYLWSVYQRSTTKQDSSGDFTWKDEAAAARLSVTTKQYVIGGMDRDFRELLYNLGHAMDAAGLRWTILSGFRDDYRQGLASGYKAHVGNSFHGGSRATGGFGHGCAADIEAASGDDGAVWKFVDQHGEKFGIFRPMKGIDPAHIQPFGEWHDVAINLRGKREQAQGGYLTASVDRTDGEKATRLVDIRSNVTEAQFDCVRSRRGGFHTASLSHRRFTMGGRMHRAALYHSGRAHRFGRRRMVVDTGSANRRAAVETVAAVPASDKAGADAKAKARISEKISDSVNVEKRAKAEASDENRRDAKRTRAADAARSDDGKHSPKHVMENAKREAKPGHARPGQTKSAQAKPGDTKAKSGIHVADQPDVSGKSDKKL